MNFFSIIFYFLSWLSKEIIIGVIIIFSTVFSSLGQGTQQNIIDSNARPIVFLQDSVSVPNDESAPSFMPNGKTVYFANGQTICFSKLINGKWSKPKTAAFSGKWKDWDSFVSPDGKRVFFVSTRPLEGMQQDSSQKNAHLWYSDHLTGDKWSPSHHLEAPINLDGVNNYAPSVSRSGDLYFFSPRRDVNNKGKSYYAKWLGNHYDKLQLLSLNGTQGTKDPFIAPDESYIIFASGNDLYISFRENNGWTAGQKLGPQVNNGDNNSSPYISPDGKMLYYSSNKIDGILMIPVHIPKYAHKTYL